MIQVLLVDDHEIFRTGTRLIIDKFPDINVVGECEDGESTIQYVKKNVPDVILMDLNMPGIGGLETTSRLKKSFPAIKIIILTVHANAPFPKSLLDAGASGYLTKGCDSDELVMAIRKVVNGYSYIGVDIAQQLALSLLPGAERSPFDDLSARELEVMLMLIRGNDNNTIAEQLYLSPKTVSTYKYRLYDKLEINSGIELMHLAIRYGMVES